MRGGGAAAEGANSHWLGLTGRRAKGQKIVGVPASESTRRQRRVSGSLILRQPRRRDGRRLLFAPRTPPRRGSLRPQILHSPRAEPTLPGPRTRRIEWRLWADRPKGPSPVASAGKPPAFRRGQERSHGQPCQLAPGLGLGDRKVCSRGSRASFWAAPSDRVFVPPLPPFLVLLAGPSGPAKSREAPGRSRARRPGMGAAGKRNKGGGGKGAQQASPACRMALRPASCRFAGTERAKRKFAPVWLGLLLRRGKRRRGLLGGTPPARQLFAHWGREKAKPLRASEATFRLRKTSSSESAAAWGATEPLGWGRWIRAPGGAFPQRSSGKRRNGARRPRKVSPPTAGSGVSRGPLKCASPCQPGLSPQQSSA